MTESNVTIDVAVRHICSILSQLADSFRILEETINSLEPQREPRMENLRLSLQQKLRVLETSIVIALTSIDTTLTQSIENLNNLNACWMQQQEDFDKCRTSVFPLCDPSLPPHTLLLDNTLFHNPSQPTLHMTLEPHDTTVSNSFWPVGTEGWHIHEMKP
jgi:hypothetical protein